MLITYVLCGLLWCLLFMNGSYYHLENRYEVFIIEEHFYDTVLQYIPKVLTHCLLREFL
jgi:hypothetical protein